MSNKVDNIEFSLIIPCFNEQDSINTVIEMLNRNFRDRTNFEIIIVNDGSTDNTSSLINEKKSVPIFNKIKIVNHNKNRGYGASLKTGIRNAKYENIVTYDADCSYPMEKIVEFVNTLHIKNLDMVVGSRTGEKVNYSKLRAIPKWFLKKWISWIANENVPDINSGLRIFKKKVAEKFLFILPNTFSFSITITLSMLTTGKQVIFEPIDYEQRTMGKSKIRPIRDTLLFLKIIVRTGLIFAPLRVLSPIIYTLFGLLSITLFIDFQNSNISDKSVVLIVINTGMIMFATLCELIVKSSIRSD